MHDKIFRIAVLHFAHETVTFLPNDTTLADFTYPGSPARGAALLASDPRGYMGGFVKQAREHADVELVGIESPLWPKTGIGSGWVTNEAFETLAGRMMEALAAEGPFDAAYLCLHGAMAVRGVARPEAELARRVRAVIGPDAPVVATFDPHGNEDEEFLRHADMAFAVKYYPHYDMYLQGERAARAVVRMLRGDLHPAHATVKVPILSPTVFQWTGASPWMDLVQRALTWEAREPDVVVNVFFGFPWSDVVDVGMCIQVMTNADPALAQRVAEDMAGFAWRNRAALVSSTTIHRIDAGVLLAREAVASGQVPVVLADHSDRSGHATWILRAIIAQNVGRVLVGTVTDPIAIKALVEAGVKAGDPFDRTVGGQMDASSGDPVRVAGTVLRVCEDVGGMPGNTWVLVAFGTGCVLMLTPFLVQILDPAEFRAIGLDTDDFDMIAIKSRVHFRRGFDDSGFAKTILLLEPDAPYLGTVRLDGLPYRNVDPVAFYPYGDPVFPHA